MNMDIRPLLDDGDLDWALQEADRYLNDEPELGTPEAARLQVLLALIENYEDKHWPIDPLASVRTGRMARRFKVHAKQRVPLREMARNRAS